MRALTNAIKKLEAMGAKAPKTDNVQNIDEIRALGFDLIELAFQSKKTKDDLYNQHDAYAFAIYSNGKLLEKHFLQPEMSKGVSKPWKKGGWPDGVIGEEAADMFIDEFAPPSQGLTLLVVNGMFYSYIQENGLGPLHSSFQVLSQIEGKIEDYGKKWNGTIIKLGI